MYLNNLAMAILLLVSLTARNVTFARQNFDLGARVTLAAIYTTENQFYKEHRTYASCLTTMNLNLAPYAESLYSFSGFLLPQSKSVTQKLLDQGQNGCSHTSTHLFQGKRFLGAQQLHGEKFPETLGELLEILQQERVATGVSDDGQKFTAISFGRLNPKCKLDVWTINEKKELKRINNGKDCFWPWDWSNKNSLNDDHKQQQYRQNGLTFIKKYQIKYE